MQWLMEMEVQGVTPEEAWTFCEMPSWLGWLAVLATSVEATVDAVDAVLTKEEIIKSAEAAGLDTAVWSEERWVNEPGISDMLDSAVHANSKQSKPLVASIREHVSWSDIEAGLGY